MILRIDDVIATAK